jgi:hypothetical protein
LTLPERLDAIAEAKEENTEVKGEKILHLNFEDIEQFMPSKSSVARFFYWIRYKLFRWLPFFKISSIKIDKKVKKYEEKFAAQVKNNLVSFLGEDSVFEKTTLRQIRDAIDRVVEEIGVLQNEIS